MRVFWLAVFGWITVGYGQLHDELRRRRQACETSLTTINGGEVTCRNQLLFEENFDGPSLNTQRWQPDIMLPQEPDFQFTVFTDDPKTLFIRDGALYLKPNLVQSGNNYLLTGSIDLSRRGCTSTLPTECAQQATGFFILPPVASSRIRTKGKFCFRYGVVEARLKMPEGHWLFPEAFLEPANETDAVRKFPRMVLGFSSGNNQLTSPDGKEIGGSRLVYSGLMLGTDEPSRSPEMKTKESTPGGEWNAIYHVYRLTWTPDGVTVTVDGQPLADVKPPTGFSSRSSPWLSDAATQTKMSPFDIEYYITLGLGVGGMRAFPDNSTSSGQPKPWKNKSVKARLDFARNKVSWRDTWAWDDSSLTVDYVKVWAL